jgi:LysR family transcriptional regulator, regulator for metE and metH
MMVRAHPPAMLEIRHLDSLIALAETGNLTRAGEKVSLSQSALSHQMRSLEEHYVRA